MFGKPRIAAAAILMWGRGDASAALVGIPWGKHKIKTPFAAKSWEDTAAMFAVAFLAGLGVLCFFGHDAFMTALPTVLLGAATGAATELFSPANGTPSPCPWRFWRCCCSWCEQLL